MNFLQRIFGSRTQRAPSGSLSMFSLQCVAEGLCDNARASHGVAWRPSLIANTNSMLPLFDSNAVLILEQVPFDALQEGDVVTYMSTSGRLIVHRLNERCGAVWWPLGDNNGTMDRELVTAANFDRRVCGILYGAKTEDTDT